MLYSFPQPTSAMVLIPSKSSKNLANRSQSFVLTRLIVVVTPAAMYALINPSTEFQLLKRAPAFDEKDRSSANAKLSAVRHIISDRDLRLFQIPSVHSEDHMSSSEARSIEPTMTLKWYKSKDYSKPRSLLRRKGKEPTVVREDAKGFQQAK